jgi:hypothetical protein
MLCWGFFQAELPENLFVNALWGENSFAKILGGGGGGGGKFCAFGKNCVYMDKIALALYLTRNATKTQNPLPERIF